MRSLSISAAWDETKATLARDGRLLASVALALVVLPAAVIGAIYPGGLMPALFAAGESRSSAVVLLLGVVLLLLLAGQLAITRLALGPSVTVGGAIAHAGRRLLPYVAVTLIFGLVLLLVMVVVALIVAVTAGSGASEAELAKSPSVALAVLLMVCTYLFLFARVLCMAAAVTVSGNTGPVQIIRRSWELTSGNFWRLLGFLLVYLIGTSIAMYAITSVAALLAQLIDGRVEPMSAGALLVSVVSAVLNGAFILVLTVMFARIYVQLAGAAPADASVPTSET